MSPIKKILTAFLIAVFVCSVASFFVDAGLKKYLLHINDKFTTMFVDTAHYDILFVGSSRTHSTIDPAVADSITKLSSYNAGLDGANMYEFKTIIDGYLEKHSPPKYLLLNIDLFSFDNRRKLFNYTYYLSYYKNEKIDSVLKENKHYSLLYRHLPFFRLGELDDYSKSNAVRGFRGKTDIEPGQSVYKGYLALANDLDTSNIKLPIETMVIDEKAVGYLDEIIQHCKKLNIKLLFTYAPEYRRMWQENVTNAKESFAVITGIAEKNTIPFYRYDSLSLCNDPSLFHNVRHLNSKGSKIFTAIVAKDILIW